MDRKTGGWRQQALNGLSVLFAPTGPMQKVCTSSGWGNDFLALADRFDAAMGKLES